MLLDLGIQGQHILNQSTIYALRARRARRVTTAYMTDNFVWGALGSAGASLAWSAGGWGAVSALGLGAGGARRCSRWALEHVDGARGAAQRRAAPQPETIA